jgi:Tfp pilus assembly protein PilF
MEMRRLENDAKRLEALAVRQKIGFVRGTLSPAVTSVAVFIICAFALRYFCIRGTIFDTSDKPAGRDVFYDAQRDFNDGNLEAAEREVTTVLVKAPAHGAANQLMARIKLARGDQQSALKYLRRSLDGSLNRDEVAKWIAALEAVQQK